MTVQVTNPKAPTKKQLADALAANPAGVGFYDPSIVNERYFTGAEIPVGTTYLPVVLDHPKRMRFAEIARRADGTFRVK